MLTESNIASINRPTSAQIDLYTINGIRDVDDDSVGDILAVHVEEVDRISESIASSGTVGHIRIISGKSGKIIRTLPTPYQEEIYVPLQLMTQFDGTEVILAVTGGQNSPGGIYLINLQTIMHYSKEVFLIS